MCRAPKDKIQYGPQDLEETIRHKLHATVATLILVSKLTSLNETLKNHTQFPTSVLVHNANIPQISYSPISKFCEFSLFAIKRTLPQFIAEFKLPLFKSCHRSMGIRIKISSLN